ncbi:hypothetical protein D1224_04305 [Henriciella barbarensis]|uniref:Uncharacterized protein n=1 Tax=Henriciella barbarensis TaxID=86342 RepID=A0A399R142_9PROT|nr:hypothetical protein D1224_04305 [Henriciella barbarensis]
MQGSVGPAPGEGDVLEFSSGWRRALVLRQAQDEGRYPSSLVQAGASLKGDTMDPCLHKGLRKGGAGLEGRIQVSITLDRVAV